MYQLSFGTPKSNEPIFIVLHGLPGVRSKQNRDLAENLHIQHKLNTQVIFYPGLGVAPGEFRFTETVSKIETILMEYTKTKQPVHLIGHSFGGYLSLMMLQKFPQLIQSLFLMSPLLFVLTEKQLGHLGHEIQIGNPQLHYPEASQLYPDYQQMTEKAPIQNFKNPPFSQTPIYLIQAKEDQITPTPIAQEFVLGTHVQYNEILQDHSFLQDREEVLMHLKNFYRSLNLI